MTTIVFTLDHAGAWLEPCPQITEWLPTPQSRLVDGITDQHAWRVQWHQRQNAPQRGLYQLGEQWADISLSYDPSSCNTHVFLQFVTATPDLDPLAAQLNQLQLITERLPILIAYVDRSIKFRFVNHYYEQWTGTCFQDIVDRTVPELLAKNCKPDIVDLLSHRINDVLAGQTTSYITEMSFPNGTLHHVHLTLLPHHRDETIPGYFVLGLDISEQVEAERDLRQSELRYRAVIESQADLVACLNNRYVCSLVNPAFAALGREGMSFWDCFVEPDPLRLMLESLTPSQPDFDLEAECWTTRGERRWHHWLGRAFFDAQSNLSEIQVVGRDVQNRHLMQAALQQHNYELESRVRQRTVELETAITALKAEVTERQRAETQLHYQAYHDLLTGLPNRKLFLERVHKNLSQIKEVRCALLFIDLDRFKVINDSLGHAIGDELLIATARRLEQCLHEGEILARWGGDEFTVLLDAVPDWSAAVHLAEVMQTAMHQPFYLQGREIHSRVSIGIALSNRDYTQADDLIRDADIAMYRAKASGGSQYQRFDRSMHLQALARLHLETELRQAITASVSPLQVYYQPIFNLKTGRMTGAEALVRWHHPHRGILKPNEILPIAKDANLLCQLDFWVISHACQQLQQWSKQLPKDFKLTVNLTPSHFNRPTLVPDLLQIVTDSGLSPAQIRVEITEETLMHEPQQAAASLSQLADYGVRAMIDDFGTGYSSLSRLHHLPIEGLKIDRAFIADLQREPVLVQMIMALANSLNLIVVAEGIEHSNQVEHLLRLGCQYGQGYYFAMPLPAPEFSRLLPAATSQAR